MITKEQLKERKLHIGASDISALFTDEDGCSLNPFATAKDIWASKVFELKPLEGDALKRGNRYESGLIEYAEEYLGIAIDTDPDHMNFVCKEHPVFACNTDGLGYEKLKLIIVECKTTGLSDEWGEPGTDDVPLRVNLQVQQQMLCTGLDKAYIAVLIGKWGLTEEMYVVERNEEIIKAIINRGEQFWNDYVLTKTPPPIAEPGKIDTFKRIIRVPEKYAEDIDNTLIVNWEQSKKELSEMIKKVDASFLEILQHLGDAEGINLNDGRELTYFEQSRKGIDKKMLAKEYPDAFDAVSTTSSYRVARIRKVK